MLKYPDALARTLSAARPLVPRQQPLPLEPGAVTAGPVAAPGDVPPFPNAAMDGFAIRAADTVTARPDQILRLPVAGSLPAGQLPPHRPAPGLAWEIMTGAPLPPGCDAVIPVEQVRLPAVDAAAPQSGAPAWVEISRPWETGRNVRLAGEDYRAGSPVLPAGRELDAPSLLALAAVGVTGLPVRGMPTVNILTTGSELAGPGRRPPGATIPDANGPYLGALLPAAGARLGQAATAGDDPSELANALQRLAAGADVLVTTGGVSAGRLDLVPRALKDLGAELLFHKVAIRPGKPVLLARLPGGPLVFGLPGNPVAVAVGFRFFVVPALRALRGLPPEPVLDALCTTSLKARGDVRFFAKARVSVSPGGQLTAAVLPGQESFRIAPLVSANAWAILPEGRPAIEPGEMVAVVSQHPAGQWQFEAR